MERLRLDLSSAFVWRVPWEVAVIQVIDSDGDLSKVRVRYTYDDAISWKLNEVKRVIGPLSLEWYIVNTEAQSGKYLELIFAKPDEVDVLPVSETRGQKAHSLRTGAITVGTSVVQGDDIAAAPDRAIVLVADSGNTGTVYVGHSSFVTTSTGFPLAAGTILQLNVDNLNDIYFVADAAGQVVRYIVEVLS